MMFAARKWIGFCAFIVMLVSANLAQSGQTSPLQLIMYEQDHCEWCEVWNKDVGVVYSKTTEGKLAPLRRVDIFDPKPKDLKHIRDSRYTPTFVLIENGKEIGRIRGYPGEDFFWGMLGELLKKHKKSQETAKKKKPGNNPA